MNISFANNFSNYHRLSSGMVESETYELVKIINAEVKAVFQILGANSILVVTDDYLWKIGGNGYVEDTIKRNFHMFSSGYSFNSEAYRDWVFSGFKFERNFDSKIDARDISDIELHELLDRSEVVEFDTRYKNTLGFVKLDDQTTLIDVERLHDKIETDCDRIGYSEGEFYKLDWSKTCLDGYTKKYHEKLTFLTKESGRFRDWTDETQKIQVRKFGRSYYYLEEGVPGQVFRFTLGKYLEKMTDIPGKLPESLWFGHGYFQLDYDAEQLNFTAWVSKKDDSINFENISFYHWPDEQEDKLLLFSIDYLSSHDYKHNLKLTSLYEQDIGLYVVRKKRSLAPCEQSCSDKQWWLELSADPAKDGQWADVSYWDGTRGDSHILNENSAVQSPLNGVPKKIAIYWPEIAGKDKAFQLHHNDYNVWLPVSSRDHGIYFELSFDENQIAEDFARFSDRQAELRLEVKLETLTGSSAKVVARLRSGKDTLMLKDFGLLARMPFEQDWKERLTGFDRGVLKLAYNRVRSKEESVYSFIDVSQKIVRAAHFPEALAYDSANYTTKLMLQSSNSDQFQEAEQVFYNYIDSLLPYTGKHGKTSDVASNALVLALISNNSTINDVVFEKLLGEDFDIEAESNNILLFNLACYYAVTHQKSLLLQVVKAAVHRGKSTEQFLTDTDFKEYWEDQDFLNLIQSIE